MIMSAITKILFEEKYNSDALPTSKSVTISHYSN